MSLFLGYEVDKDGNPTEKRLEIPAKILVRHMAAFGSTGSGKTVLAKIIIEEAAKEGIPIIALDPQGDIASLIKLADPKVIEEHGLPLKMLREYKDKVYVKIFTPASTKGLPICIDPIVFPDAKAEHEDAIRLLDNSSRTLVRVLVKVTGLPGSYESKAFAVIYELMKNYWQKEKEIKDLKHLADLLVEDPLNSVDYAKYLKAAERERLSQSIRSLTIGTSELLFELGERLDITKLITKEKGRTPINVFFLKTLTTDEERHFFISILVNRLYDWMINQGSSKKPRLIFFIDEIAPFCPSGTVKPGPKEGLKLIFRQARKYGVICIIATQSPKDVDYKAFEQMNTYAIGRITARQSREAIEHIVTAGAGETRAAKIINKLPRLEAGHFVLVSPDLKKDIQFFKTRWLLTEHETLTENDVRKLKEALISAGIIDESTPEVTKAPKVKPKEVQPPTEAIETKIEIEKPGTMKPKEKIKEKEISKEEDILEDLPTPKMSEEELETALKRPRIVGVKTPSSNEDVIAALAARIEELGHTEFGLEFLRDLVKKGQLKYPIAREWYYIEVKTALKTGLAHLEGEKLVYDFEKLLKNVLDEIDVSELNVNESRVRKKFEKIIKSAKRANFIEYILLGRPFLKY
ncbi:MAG: ATP-binding protein [Candidatus Sifarchaeia archaeon]|jgi:DNA helicase HerA-like ATPase